MQTAASFDILELRSVCHIPAPWQLAVSSSGIRDEDAL
jgi:hypothetical protein